MASRCGVCGLDLSPHDSGDGAAVFVILILGFVVVGLALVTEMAFEPPVRLHLLLWTPLILGASLGLLGPFKATLIAFKYKHRIRFDDETVSER